MRNTLASLLLTLATFSGTVALTAHMTAQTFLNPGRAGTLAASVVSTDGGRSALIGALERSSGKHLDTLDRAQLDQAFQDPRVTGALDDSTLSAEGTLHLGGARDALAQTLRANGADNAAAKVSQAEDAQLPASVTAPYIKAKDTAGTAARYGVIALVGLIAAAIVVAVSRGYVMRRAGMGLLGSVAMSLLLFKSAPMLASKFTDADVAAASWSQLGAGIVAPLVVAAVAGGGLIVAGTAYNAGRRVTR
jgi:hypothetical protein